jgi:hypothetical protein
MMELDVRDIQQMYGKSIVFYQNKPVYVEAVGDNGEMVMTNLITQRGEMAKFSSKEFTAPMRRLGMVNVKGSVMYTSRTPVRRFKVGICAENIRVEPVEGVDYPAGRAETKHHVMGLCLPELGDTLFGKYPTFKQALTHVENMGGAVAFDRQFAIARGRKICYKSKVVGKIPAGKSNIKDIQFDKGYEHLTMALKGEYEKAV